LPSANPPGNEPAGSRQTNYNGPVTVSRLEFAGYSVGVVRPADPDLMLDDLVVHAWNQRDDYMPYWAYMWPGSLLLAEVVAREPWAEENRPREVLEIGCGVGLAGLVCLSRGLRVCFSDYDQAALDFVARSAEVNGWGSTHFRTRLLDWRDLPAETYPVIVGSDLLYERRLVPLVAGVLAALLEPGGMGLLSCPGRASAQGFPAALEALGLDVRVDVVESRSEAGEPLRGVIYRVWNNHAGSRQDSASRGR
jgi:predicted nicotinamide N-methyase